jgi:hypothetical protein
MKKSWCRAAWREFRRGKGTTSTIEIRLNRREQRAAQDIPRRQIVVISATGRKLLPARPPRFQMSKFYICPIFSQNY